MKNRKWLYIAVILLGSIGITSLVLSIATDLNDNVFLPVALGCISGANLLIFLMNIRMNRNNGE